jgi:RNA polymerase sigma-70 factor (ECF subfamily)
MWGNFSLSDRVSNNNSSVKDDFQFVEATLAGQKEAFGQLVERYQDRLIHAISRYLGSVEDAHDVAQDAFVQAYTRLASFRGEAAFYTWLYRIAFNLAMTRVRRRRPMQSLDQAKDSLGNEPIDLGATVETGILREEQARVVHTALGQLDEEFRQVIVLRELEGCAYEQIAQILEIPVGTVRSRLYRARIQLRDCLAPWLTVEIGETNEQQAIPKKSVR